MKKSVEAALYSGLLFPGTGHFILKKFKRGLIFFTPSLAGLLYLVNDAINKASSIAEQIIQGDVSLDPDSLANLISAQSSHSELLLMQLLTWILGIIWGVGIIDAYRLGKSLDQAKHP